MAPDTSAYYSHCEDVTPIESVIVGDVLYITNPYGDLAAILNDDLPLKLRGTGEGTPPELRSQFRPRSHPNCLPIRHVGSGTGGLPTC